MIKFWLNLATALFLIATGMVIWSMGPELESKIYPVLGEQIPTVTREGNRLWFQVEINKLRDCPMEDIVFHVVIDGIVPSYQAINVVNMSGSVLTKGNLRKYPAGHIMTGPFETYLPSYYALADKVIGYAQYKCHPFWLTPQIYGPFPVPKLENLDDRNLLGQ